MALELLRFDSEPVRRERLEKDTIQSKQYVFVDYIFDAVQARFGGSHQGARGQGRASPGSA